MKSLLFWDGQKKLLTSFVKFFPKCVSGIPLKSIFDSFSYKSNKMNKLMPKFTYVVNIL